MLAFLESAVPHVSRGRLTMLRLYSVAPAFKLLHMGRGLASAGWTLARGERLVAVTNSFAERDVRLEGDGGVSVSVRGCEWI